MKLIRWYVDWMRYNAEDDPLVFGVGVVMTIVIIPVVLFTALLLVSLFLSFPVVMFIIAFCVAAVVAPFVWLYKTRDKAPPSRW